MTKPWPTAEKYYEAFKKSYAKLIDALPINDLLPRLFEAGVVLGNMKEKLNSIHSVRSEKVTCLLDKIELGLNVGITDQFESFICVMEEYGADENDIVVQSLAKDIRSMICNSEMITENFKILESSEIQLRSTYCRGHNILNSKQEECLSDHIEYFTGTSVPSHHNDNIIKRVKIGHLDGKDNVKSSTRLHNASGQSQEQIFSSGRQEDYSKFVERTLKIDKKNISMVYCQLLVSGLLICFAFCYLLVLNQPGNSSVATLPPTFSSSAPQVGPAHSSSPVIKTPVSKLHEYCQRNNLKPPDYKERQITGGFCFMVTVKGKQYDGEIKSKKQDAKHSAANVALQQLYSSRSDLVSSYVRHLKEKYFDKNKIAFKKENYFKTNEVDRGYQCTLSIDGNDFVSKTRQSKADAENDVAKQALGHLEL